MVGRRIWKRTFGKLKIETSVQMFVYLASSTAGGVGGLEIGGLMVWWFDGLVNKYRKLKLLMVTWCVYLARSTPGGVGGFLLVARRF